jgi:hypothetical protein
MEASAEWLAIEEMVDAVTGRTSARWDLVPQPEAKAGIATAVATSSAPGTGGEIPPHDAPPPVQTHNPTRMVVEQGRDRFVMVLKVLNSATGDVLTEIPSQTPQQAGDHPPYHAGSLLNHKV